MFLFSALISTAVIFVAMLFLFSQELGVSDVRVKLSNLSDSVILWIFN